jgi:sulfite reductase alpha subunit-like flavoprotein
VQLGGVRYAMFGMGDRSYEKTYSRGSEMVDEALAACGAVRVGEYGRHDAGGPISATEAAVDWVSGVLAEMAVVPAG